MAHRKLRPAPGGVWALASAQHGVVSRAQLLDLGLSPSAITHRIRSGRLHPVRRGVYAVGRPDLGPQGRWLAAVLSCGAEAALSHGSAAALWGIGGEEAGRIEVSVPAEVFRRRGGIVLHRRATLRQERTVHIGVPVTAPAVTLVDIAPRLMRGRLEAAINDADKRGLVSPVELRSAVDSLPRRPGVTKVRDVLDRRTFTLTDSALERRLLGIVREAGLPRPETQREISGLRVDFYWPDVGLVVETDGLRYHRTPASQARDRLRDQALAAAGLTCLRFTHAQVWYEPGYVRTTLVAVHHRLREARPVH